MERKFAQLEFNFEMRLEEKQTAINELTAKVKLCDSCHKNSHERSSKAAEKTDSISKTHKSDKQDNEHSIPPTNINSNNFIGFMTSASANNVYTDGEMITFDVVHLNAGDGYDSTLKVFNCPVSGYYLFSVTLSSADDGYDNYGRIDGKIVVASSTQVKAIATHHKDITQGTTLGIYRCEINQQVYILAGTDELNTEGVYGGEHSAFSGFLISADST